MVWKSGYLGVVRNVVPAAYQFLGVCGLKMVSVLEALDAWLGHNILSDVKLQVPKQKESPPDIAFVDIDFVEAHL
jgi:hypothetical protein